MRIVRNSIIPFRGFKALALWPLVFVRKEATVSGRDIRHEEIHCRQQKEFLVVPFLLWYGIEWLVRLAVYRNARKAYRTVSFEQEAYLNEQDAGYLESRKCFAWIKYIFN